MAEGQVMSAGSMDPEGVTSTTQFAKSVKLRKKKKCSRFKDSISSRKNKDLLEERQKEAKNGRK